MKTRGQICNEIYEIVYGKDIRILHGVMSQLFPKSRRSLDKLRYEELSDLVPVIREAYQKAEEKQKLEIPLGGEA